MWIIFYNYTIEGDSKQLSILTVMGITDLMRERKSFLEKMNRRKDKS